MIQNRLLMVGLDGFDISYAERLIDAGALPNIARLRLCSAPWKSRRFFLTARTYLFAWEFIAAPFPAFATRRTMKT